MASTKELQKTLPRHCPNSDKHRTMELNRNFAIYSLANLNAAQLEELQDSINSEVLTDKMTTSNSRLAPQPDFSGRTLRDVYDHHIATRDEHDWMDPLYFIVADQEDWKTRGLLAVYLEAGLDDEDDRIGVGRCGFDMADTWGVNFSVANEDWMDLKEAEQHEWGGDNPYEEDEKTKDDGVE